MTTEDRPWSAQLAQLRDLTDKTGILHEAQVLQLKLWPYLALRSPPAKSIQIVWDSGEHDGTAWVRVPSVTFQTDADMSGEPAGLIDRIEHMLFVAIRHGICSVAAVRVECGDKKVWDSREDLEDG